MKSYNSSSSNLVKLITIGTFTVLIFVAFILIFVQDRWGSFTGGAFLAIVLSTFYYFYSQSLQRVIITDDNLILKKNLGKTRIDFDEITAVLKLKYADIPMTIGSKGVFGFIGKTMDGSKSFVKNRRAMVQVVTANKKYLISCDDRDAFVQQLRQKIVAKD